jgi:diacylglycerol kinase (ATP)
MIRGRLFLLVNTGAREGRVLSRLNAALATAPAVHQRAHVIVANTLDEARASLYRLAEDDVPVAVGGDGTVNLVVSALRAEGYVDRPIGILPLGTGNAFAHALGIGTLPRALAALQLGVCRAVDVVRLEQHPLSVAVASVSAGFEASALLGTEKRRSWSRATTFMRAAVGAALRVNDGVSIELDGQPFLSAADRVYNAGLYLLPCYGFGLRVLPDAKVDDGAGEAVVWLSGSGYWHSLRAGVPIDTPSHRSDIRVRRWRRARIALSGPLQVDGESTVGGVVDMTIEPGGLRVFVLAEP